MTLLNRSQLRERLKRRELAPVYLLYGPERYLRGLAARTIAEFAIPDPAMRGFNEHTISLRESSIRDVVAAAEQLPVGGGRRVVVVKDLFISANRAKSSLKGDADEILYSYLRDPSNSTVVVFIAEEFDKRLKAAKQLRENAVAVEFSAMSFDEAVKWVRDRLRKESAEADQQTVNEIVNLAGEDAGKLKVEVEKLATAALPEKLVTKKLVRRLVKHSRVLSNFDLTDHLVAGRREAALAAMRKILDDGGEPLMLLGLLSYNFRQLFIANQLMSEGLDRSAVIKEMKLRGRPDRMLAAARRAETGRFEHILKRLSETDLAIKTSRGAPRVQIEMLICELAVG